MRIAVVGDYNVSFESHPATTAALLLAGENLRLNVAVEWVPTPAVTDERLGTYDGIWAAPGSPYESFDGMLHAIRFARERGKPMVAT